LSLFVRETNTSQALDWYKAYGVVIWWATPVEIVSALARLLRVGHLSTSDWQNALKSVQSVSETWFVVPPTSALRSRAVEIVKLYDLRAADSLQLAAAFEWCEGAPQNRKFFTTDIRLLQAAKLNGFDA